MRIIFILLLVISVSCSSSLNRKEATNAENRTTITTNAGGSGSTIDIDFYKGKSFYRPLMAFWLEDTSGNYIQTLYVARSVATGTFRYAKQSGNKWIPGPKRAPQTLPYWAHKRGVQASDGLYMPEPEKPVADAYTGATPLTGFSVHSKSDNPLPDKFNVMMEINENWDWNQYWTNDKYPDDEYYKMSCQPAVVYSVLVDRNRPGASYKMKPAGHSHYSGKTGELFPDLSTLTTALHIADSVIVRVNNQ